MKILYTLFIGLFLFVTVNAQDKLSTISLSVVMPDNIEELTSSQISKIETKVIEFVSNNGLSATGLNQFFVIYPKFEIYKTQKTQGGMMALTAVDASISFIIKQVATNTIFSTLTKSLKGNGTSKDDAINDAINSINPSDTKFETFIKQTKEKIIKYYNSNCDVIIKKAENDARRKEYETALSILLTIPEEANVCYDKAQAKAKTIFNDYQKQNCNKLLLKAKTEIASGNYEDALKTITQIDPLSTCGKELKELIKTAANKVEVANKKNWDLMLNALNNIADQQRLSTQAMTNLAESFLQAKPKPSYNIIIN